MNSTLLGVEAGQILQAMEGRDFWERWQALVENVPPWIALVFLENELPPDFFDCLDFNWCAECLLFGWWCDKSEKLHAGLVKAMVETGLPQEWLGFFEQMSGQEADTEKQPLPVLRELLKEHFTVFGMLNSMVVPPVRRRKKTPVERRLGQFPFTF